MRVVRSASARRERSSNRRGQRGRELGWRRRRKSHHVEEASRSGVAEITYFQAEQVASRTAYRVRSRPNLRLFLRQFGAGTRQMAGRPRTLYDKIWDDHVVHEQEDGACLIYIDRHLIHEVTSPQAFEGLRITGRKVRAPQKTLAVVDHNVPTTDRSLPITDPESKAQVEQLAINAARIRRRILQRARCRGRASSISSARSRASPCRARRSSAATATPPRMARSARSPMASARPRSSMFWRRRR